MRAISVVGAAVAMVACGVPTADTAVPTVERCLSAADGPVSIDVLASETWTGSIAVDNACDSARTVSFTSTVPGLVGPEGAVDVPAGGSSELDLSFTPDGFGSVVGTVLLAADNGEALERAVDVLVSGPRLEIDDSATVTTVPAGCNAVQAVQLRNTGNLPLNITSVEGDNVELAVGNFDGAVQVAAGGAFGLELRSRADVERSTSTTLTILTDEYGRGTVTHVVDVTSTYDNPQSRTESLAPPKLDVLLVMDRSPCNTDHLETMPEEVPALQSSLRGLDYRLAIAVADDGCIVGDVPYIDGAVSADRASTIAATMTDKDYELAETSADEERGFTLARRALTAADGCNADVFREDAFLHLINHSDEPEQTPGPYADQVAWFQDFREAGVVQHAVGGPAPDGCESAGVSWGYWEAVADTGGVFRNICEIDPSTYRPRWDLHFAAFGDFMRSTADHRVEITPPALPGTVSLAVDGRALEAGWSVDPSGGLLTIDAQAVSASAELTIAYQAAPEVCP